MRTEKETADRVSAYLQHGGLLEQMLASDVYWHWRYTESNPDVGMGPSLSYVIDEHIAAHKLEGIVSKSEVLRIVHEILGG